MIVFSFGNFSIHKAIIVRQHNTVMINREIKYIHKSVLSIVHWIILYIYLKNNRSEKGSFRWRVYITLPHGSDSVITIKLEMLHRAQVFKT